MPDDILHNKAELNDVASYCKSQKKDRYKIDVKPYNKQSFANTLAYQVAALVGLAHMHNIDLIGALQEVNRSNWSKFENGKPVFDENGKIKKGKDYTPPELSKFVGE